MTTAVATLTCGHEPTRDEFGIGTGYATDRETGETSCYPCADERQRNDIKNNPTTPFIGYLNGDAKTVTTWTGGELARVTGMTTARGGLYGTKVYRVWAVTPDGLEWYGQNAGTGSYIKMRPVNRKKDR